MAICIGKQCARFGVISDTHGLFRPEITSLFEGVDYILHAGDIGKPAVLHELNKIAPTISVLGNMDISSWFPGTGKTEIVETENRRIMILHSLDELDLDPGASEIDVVIHGHSHKPSAHRKKGVWYVNPGSAGPPRFLLPVSVAVMEVSDSITVKHHTIKGGLSWSAHFLSAVE